MMMFFRNTELFTHTPFNSESFMSENSRVRSLIADTAKSRYWGLKGQMNQKPALGVLIT